ncbi:unnamed protein product [Effrenium voratum]|nr:unnamed protein product [Effrenium voratum]
MAFDEALWQSLGHECRFKVIKDAPCESLCRHEYSATGLCNRSSCPLANGHHATVSKRGNIFVLHLKTPESREWKMVKLCKSVASSLGRLAQHAHHLAAPQLENAQKRLRSLGGGGQQLTTCVAEKKKSERREAKNEKKAEAAAQVENSIGAELLRRMRLGVYARPEENQDKSSETLPRRKKRRQVEVEYEEVKASSAFKGVNDFREDLKRMMMDVLKGEGKGLAFLFSDTQIVKESFLEDINNILNTGEVPNLFLAEEMEQVIGLARPLAKAAGKVDARDVLWQHFVQVVREGFHIILAFSPVGEGFRARCRQFPSLINCATVDWYDPWPEDALVSVAERYYREAPKELELDASIAALSKISCVIHASSSEAAERFFDELRRKTYMTPTSYLELIKLFTDLLGMKKGELDTKLNRYRVGAQRLKETETVVDKLKVDLTKMQPVIEQGKKDTAALIVQVTMAKQVRVQDLVEAHSAIVQSASDEAILEKLQGTSWKRQSDGNPMGRIFNAEVLWDSSFKSANSHLSSNGTNVLVMSIKDKEKAYSFSGEANVSSEPFTITWSDGVLPWSPKSKVAQKKDMLARPRTKFAAALENAQCEECTLLLACDFLRLNRSTGFHPNPLHSRLTRLAGKGRVRLERLDQVDKEEAVAKEAQASCEVDEREAGEAAATANSIKTECQRELDEALPEYYDAIKALDSLDKKDIQEVKSFAKPAPLVEVVLSAVCLLMNRKESWDEAKKLMNDSGFLQSLKDYDKDALAGNAKLTQKLQKYVKREDFQPDQVKKVSNAATSLCMWVRAMDVYARVARSIEPKKEKLKGAEDALAAAEGKLQAKKKELKAVQDNVAELQSQLSSARTKAEKLEQDAETCKVKLGRAEKLLAGLGNESVRWDAASKILEKNIKFVMGDIALAAGFVAYAGPFTAEFRAGLVGRWLSTAQEVNLTADPAWKCADTLCEPAEIREWNIKSLPSDDLSIENGLLVTRGRRWPLMIDPQGQGNRWIRNMKKDGLGIIKLSTPNFLRTVENCIREGSAVLLENVEEVLDPSLEPVLLKQVFKKGGQMLLRLGSEDVPYHDDFRFFVTTKMANPHYLPEICIKVTVINFTVTLLGLEDQLVADVVKNERPDLAELRANLVVQIAKDKAEMDRLEQLILKLLSEAGADLLSDDTLIVTLDQSKLTGDSCKERMASAEKSMKEIDEVTEVLRPCATRASIIYFVVADLANIDPMYQYSLQFFASLFQQRLATSEMSEDPQERIHIIIKDFTEFIYKKICMGLFEDHKLLYAFMICNRCLRHEAHAKFMGKQRITPEEWSFFLRGVEAAKGLVDVPSAEGPAWLGAGFRKIQVLEELTAKSGNQAFKGLAKDMFTTAWEDFGTDDNMTSRELPEPLQRVDVRFRGVAMALRENFLQLAPASKLSWESVVRNFVGAELGSLYTVSPDFDLLGCFKDSKKTMPLIFVLSAGADPTDYLVKLARDFNYEERLHFISLGQGQGTKAENLIKMGQESGDWVCLQNCHLAASWMPTLERIQEMQEPDSIDDMYRLWLTSMPSTTFPVPVLQGGIKITNEPPKGLRANLSRSFQDITEEIYEGCSKSREYKKLLRRAQSDPCCSVVAENARRMRALELEERLFDEENPPKEKCPAEKDRGPTLAWWFRACCFCYSAVGADMAWRIGYVTCHCAAYPWQLEASLLLLQGCLSFMHDAYFAGRSPAAKMADRCCASFLTLCQPLKLAFCSMDAVQLCVLCCSWTLGLLCFKAGARAFAAGNGRRYQIFHTLWHILLPLGGYLWIEYTRLSVLLLHSSALRRPLLSSQAIWARDVGGEDVSTLLFWGPGNSGPECLHHPGSFLR